MAELLIRVVDKTNHDDPYLDAQLTKRGDVICVQPDGWPWGTEELKNPDWRIIKLPGIEPEKLDSLLVGEIDADPKQPSRVLQRRAFKFDLDHIALTADRHYLDDATRAQASKTMPLTLAQVLAVRARKARLRDPNVFELEAGPALEL